MSDKNMIFRSSRVFGALLLVLLVQWTMGSPLWADSRSQSVRVSCTILPTLEISVPIAHQADPVRPSSAPFEMSSDARNPVQIRSNLGPLFTLSECRSQRLGSTCRLFSVTAL